MQGVAMITAHSGSDGRPDNSLAYVTYALSTQADALEVDIQKDPDSGELIITHDEVLDPNANYPRLREVFALLAKHPKMRINCDLKVGGLERDVYALAEEEGVADRLIYSGTVDVTVMEEWPPLKNVEVFLNLEEYVENLFDSFLTDPDFDLAAAKTICAVCKQHHIRVVNVNYHLATRRFIRFLAAEGIGVSVWTVNDQYAMAFYLSERVYNMTTRQLQYALSFSQDEHILNSKMSRNPGLDPYHEC